MGKFARSWELSRQSLAVLRSDKQLLMFPIFSSIACILVLATFALPLAVSIDWSTLSHHVGEPHQKLAVHPWYYPVLFIYYFVNFLVITFFNSALVTCALRKFNGEPASVQDGLQVAISRLPQIIAWSLVASTIGMVLNMIQERAGFIGKIVIGLVGMAWTIATFFVVPVLVVEKVGPIDAIKRSVQILRKTWGESLIANVGIGAVSTVLFLIGFVVAIAMSVAVAAMNAPALIIAIAVLFVIYLLFIGLLVSTLQGILLAATYRYASTGLVPSGFDPNIIQSVFATKTK